MSLPAAVQWGIVALVFVVAFAVGRRVETPEGAVSAPTWVKTALAGLAIGGPWVLHARGLLSVGLVDDTVLTIAVSLGLYLAVAMVVGVGGSHRTC